MYYLKHENQFPLGRTVITANAKALLPDNEVQRALQRHEGCDWGDVEAGDREQNETALLEGSRLLSVYHTAAGMKFWIITEADRSVTTVLMPQDY